MSHQITGCARLAAAPTYFALGAEQGTGKTWMLLADAETQFQGGRISALLIVAPKGVHTNWILREIPTHLSIETDCTLWSGKPGKKAKAVLERQVKAPRSGALMVHAINIDAINTDAGYDQCDAFLRAFPTYMVIDESQRIKNIAAKRTKRIIELGKLAVTRRIASGTLVANSPLDVFGQFEFLSRGLLGTTSYRAFVAEYADLMSSDSQVVQAIMRKSGRGGVPQVIARDASGLPKYRNLEKLTRLMAPHTFRVLKKDCLDLPEKIYKTVFFDLETSQRIQYDNLLNERRFERDDGNLDTFTALTIINKLRQVTSGFIMVDGEPTELRYGKPRLDALLEIVEDLDGPFIVWASFREEIRQIVEALSPFGPVVQYHGGTKPQERTAAIDAFQSGAARIFVAMLSPSGGAAEGLTLTAAETAIYYSNLFSLGVRQQSEDRPHRIGLHHPVVYIDLVARDTIDERIARVLQSKSGVAQEILRGL